MSIKKNFIQSIVDKFVVGKNDTRVGVVALGFLDDTVLPLDALESASSLGSYINNDNGSLPSITEFLRPDVGKVSFSTMKGLFSLILLFFLAYGGISIGSRRTVPLIEVSL